MTVSADEILGAIGALALLPRMNTNEHESKALDAVVEGVIGCAYEVSSQLGAGFLEKVYERALARELGLRGMKVSLQVPYPISYKGQAIGEYIADMLVEDKLIQELKCVERFSNEHMAQCINYLKASKSKTSPANQLPKAKGRMEKNQLWLSIYSCSFVAKNFNADSPRKTGYRSYEPPRSRSPVACPPSSRTPSKGPDIPARSRAHLSPAAHWQASYSDRKN